MTLRSISVVISMTLVLVVAVWIGRRANIQPATQPATQVVENSGESSSPAWAVIERKQAKLAAQGPKSFDHPQQALDFFVQQRLEPGEDSLPIEHLHAERLLLEDREQQQGPAAFGGTVKSVKRWTSIGPGNIGGRTRAIAIDPNNSAIMHAAGVAGGIWKSTDAGATWRVIDDLMLNLAVCTIVIDPNDSNILYAGTGEGYYGSDVFVRGLGIFKSIDAGETWEQLQGTVTGVPTGAFYYVNKLVISSNNSNRIYAATRSGVWRSLDAGGTWSIVLSNPFEITTPPTTNGCLVGCTDLAIRSDRNPDVLFAAFGSFVRDGLYRSDNGGQSWLAYTTGSQQGRMTLAIAPSNNDIIYLMMADNGTAGDTGQLVQVFRAVDGSNFVPRVNLASLTGPWLLSNLVFATGCAAGGTYSQGWYDNSIAVDPVDPEIVWVGGIDLFRSNDGAANFGIASYWFYFDDVPQPPYYAHPDQHTIVFHPGYDGVTNQTMYVGNDGGIFRTENARAATSQEDCPFPANQPLPDIVWENLNNGYGVTQFYHGDSARDLDVFVGGAQDNGTSRVQARTTPNSWDLIFGGDGGYVAIDPANSQTMFVEYQFFPTIQKSIDGGQSFFEATTGITDTDGAFITPFAMDQTAPNVIWSGGSRPWRTTDGAASWSVAGPNLTNPRTISAIGIAPSDGNIVYLGYDNGYVAKTNNGLAPQPSFGVRSAGLIRGWISSVAVDPVDPNIAYCTYSNYGITHVFRTMNGGNAWSSIDGIGATGVPDIPVHCVAVRPRNPRQIFAGTELGVFASNDQGETWTPVNQGLAHTVVEWLDFKDVNTLVAFTHGRGAYFTTVLPALR